MNNYIFYTLGFFLILHVIFINEGFINNYESNETLSNEPDNIQYYSCRQDVFTENLHNALNNVNIDNRNTDITSVNDNNHNQRNQNINHKF